MSQWGLNRQAPHWCKSLMEASGRVAPEIPLYWSPATTEGSIERTPEKRRLLTKGKVGPEASAVLLRCHPGVAVVARNRDL